MSNVSAGVIRPTNTLPKPKLFDRIMGYAGTISTFNNMLVSSIGKWAAQGVTKAASTATAAASWAEITGGNVVSGVSSGGLKGLANTIFNNRIVGKVMGMVGTALSVYSLYQGFR